MLTTSNAIDRVISWAVPSFGALGERIASVSALGALVVWISAPLPPLLATVVEPPDEVKAANSPSAQSEPEKSAPRREHLIGGYGGVTLTLPSTVAITNPGRTDMTVRDFSWIGRPFKSPIYYGLRSQHWSGASPFGGMVDFTHAKAIAPFEDVATFSGVHNGQPLQPKAQIGDVFKHFEFSHGHNIFTLNGLIRMPALSLPIRPYFGLGGGASFPHTEIGFKSENQRTYEYQFAGFAGQFLVGVQVPLGRVSAFVEYKFTYAPYSVPLSQEPRGSLVVTDIWRQFSAWWKGEAPPGGVLNTTLITHHGIGGLLFRTSSGR